MEKTGRQKLLCVVALAFCLSFLSAQPGATKAQPLTKAAEIEAVGGSKCTAAVGLGLALGVAALSPCSIVCATLAWYDLALIGAFCD